MTIRFADKADCAAITEIYNHVRPSGTIGRSIRITALPGMRPVNYWAIWCW